MTDFALPDQSNRENKGRSSTWFHPVAAIVSWASSQRPAVRRLQHLRDVDATGAKVTTYLRSRCFVALLIALGFEFVNGFTTPPTCARSSTPALPANVAVVWSGCFNLLGVLACLARWVRHRVAAACRVDLAGRQRRRFCHGVALLIAAIAWNLGTWWLGLRHRVRTR